MPDYGEFALGFERPVGLRRLALPFRPEKGIQPMLGSDLLATLAVARGYRSRRCSSYDRSGGNLDWVPIKARERVVVADISGAGIIKHIWMTVAASDRLWPRQLVLRMWWDGEATPSVEVPIGDFFGVGHARVSHFMSLPLNMVTGPNALKDNRAAMNCFFPMPFERRAHIEIENESDQDITSLYYYVDYEEHEALPPDMLRFHAQWRRENPTAGYETWQVEDPWIHFRDDKNTTGDGNYVILDATGRGHYAGCVVSIKNVMYNDVCHTWFGEGDDMIFVDGEKWPPALHGTGTEDYFCAAWGYPSGQYDGPFHGISLAGNPDDYTGWWTMYRFHLESPVTFRESIRVTIEHGHNNARYDDWSSVAYWYQTEPHGPFPAMPPVSKRLPRPLQHWEKQE